MSWIGAIIGTFASGKSMVRKDKISEDLAAASNRALPYITQTANELKKWGKDDWSRFKETYRPVAESLVNDANRAPNYNRYEQDVALGASQGQQAGNEDIRRGISQSGTGPASGKFASATSNLENKAAARRGIGTAVARQTADQESTNKKMSLLPLGRSDPSSSVAGLGIVTRGGADYGKYSSAIGVDATKNLGEAGFGIGKALGSYKPTKDTSTPTKDTSTNNSPFQGNGALKSYANTENNSSPTDSSGNYNSDFMGYTNYAEGGMIAGPGNGRSDSIQANIDGRMPARVSNGEYLIKANVASSIGLNRLDSLISIARQG